MKKVIAILAALAMGVIIAYRAIMEWFWSLFE